MIARMTQDKPDRRNILDRMAQGVIGAPLPRPDGLAKVTGTATYAAEYAVNGCLEGVIVTAPFAVGTITAIDSAVAEGMAGVVAVIADERLTVRPAQGGAGEAPEQGPRKVEYFGQPVAVVVADTFENARDAAKAVRLVFTAGEGARFEPDDAPTTPDEEPIRQGDLAHAMSAAEHAVDVEITTEGHASAAMEPHAAIAEWDGHHLTVHASLQMLNYNIAELADAVGLEESQVRLVARYVGGGFGSKLGISEDVVAASLAAMQLGRAVRVCLSRQQVFQTIIRRSETRQRLRLAADASGKLDGFGHEAFVSNLPGEDFAEPVTQSSEFLYAGANRLTGVELARVHRMTAGSVRAPGEAVGMPALEVAMDMLAEAAGIDPVDLRLRNIPDCHPTEGTPFSGHSLAECLTTGASAFGWQPGARVPRQRREGEWWIGTGMASAARVHNIEEAKARVTLQADGTAMVQTDMTDIGTGTYTVLSQLAGEMLGLDPARVLVDLGDTRFPRGPGSGGSWGAASTGSAVFVACQSLRKALARMMDTTADALRLKDGTATANGRAVPLAELLAGQPLVRTGHYKPGAISEDFVAAGYGAFFAEVQVNHYTGETRVRRMLGAFGFGRVLNAMTARSQCLGGITWSIGSALTEGLLFDPVDGHLVNCDLAEYHVPVHRDVPDCEVILLEERDAAASPIQAKGIGELGMCGGAGAIANAIYNACGARVLSFPMTPDRVLAALPE